MWLLINSSWEVDPSLNILWTLSYSIPIITLLLPIFSDGFSLHGPLEGICDWWDVKVHFQLWYLLTDYFHNSSKLHYSKERSAPGTIQMCTIPVHFWENRSKNEPAYHTDCLSCWTAFCLLPGFCLCVTQNALPVLSPCRRHGSAPALNPGTELSPSALFLFLHTGCIRNSEAFTAPRMQRVSYSCRSLRMQRQEMRPHRPLRVAGSHGWKVPERRPLCCE